MAVHEGPIKACHWIKAPNYSVLMTGSYDKTLKFWDGRQKEPVLKLNLPERCFAADVKFPYAVVSPANYGKTLVYKLDNGPREDRQIDNHFDGRLEQRRCISLLKDQSGTTPCGFASGTTNGHGIIQYFSQNISLKVLTVVPQIKTFNDVLNRLHLYVIRRQTSLSNATARPFKTSRMTWTFLL